MNEMTERVYIHTPPEHIVTNVVSGRKMRIQKYNFPDTVIWNPWEQRAKAELNTFLVLQISFSLIYMTRLHDLTIQFDILEEIFNGSSGAAKSS